MEQTHANTGMLPERPPSTLSPENSMTGNKLTQANLHATNMQAQSADRKSNVKRRPSNSSNIAGAVTYHGITISKSPL
jgi:hypothetical protein